MTDQTETVEALETEAETEPAAALPHPRIRTGAVVWGVLVLAVAAGALWLQTSPARLSAAASGLADVGLLAIGVGALVLIGGAIVLIAGSVMVRRAQIRRGGSR